ncbi:MAG TPA: hypothetical protein VLW50_15830 [Streptosporangiaceae bacterium]|nr:hypothetical protein [Streptosporangiaceae bacterium]
MIKTAPKMTRLARLARWLGLDRNPLRRRSDRAEASIIAALLGAFLVGAPLAAVSAGHLAQAASMRVRHTQQAWHRVPATLIDNAPKDSSFMYESTTFAWVRARWTAPDGSVRVGEVPTPGGTTAGHTVRIWIDGAGRETSPPLTSAQLVDRVVAGVIFAPIALAVLLLSVGAVACRLLERHRLSGWEAAWEAIEPQWSHRS